jgi:hypothetical protein
MFKIYTGKIGLVKDFLALKGPACGFFTFLTAHAIMSSF